MSSVSFSNVQPQKENTKPHFHLTPAGSLVIKNDIILTLSK